MECFVTIVNGWKPLTIITKGSNLDVAAALDPPLLKFLFGCFQQNNYRTEFLLRRQGTRL